MTHDQLKEKIAAWLAASTTWGIRKDEILQRLRVYNIDYSVSSSSPNVIEYRTTEASKIKFSGTIVLNQ